MSEGWCGSGDLNPDGIATASPSSWCVCQFRHFRVAVPMGRCRPAKAGLYNYLVAGAGAVAGAGVVGAGAAGAGFDVAGAGPGVPLMTELVPPR